MATESPIRMPGTSAKWSPMEEGSTFTPPTSMVTEDLGSLSKGHRFHGSARDSVPNRSGSAPPSMEGSFLAIGNLISQKNYSFNADLESLNSVLANCESEEQLRADPAYLAYYCSNINLNPRLPPPLISWENRRLVRHIGSFGNSWELTSVGDKGNTSLHMPQGVLSTHKEECEDDHTPQQPSDDQVDHSSILWPVQDAAFDDQVEHKKLLQEQLPNDPSCVYSQSYSLSHGVTKESVDHDANSASLNDTPGSTSNPIPSILGSDDIGITSNSDHSAGSVSRSSSLHHTGSLPNTPPPQSGMLENADIHAQDELLISGVSNSHVPVIESEMKALNLSSLPSSGKQRNQEQWHQSLPQPQGLQQSNKSQMPSQGRNSSFIGTDHFLNAPSKFSADQILQSSGFTPPLYATAAAYMTSANPLYPNQPAPALFPPQYGVGGYPFNSNVFPPYIAGYPHGAVPLVFDGNGAAGPSFHARTNGMSTDGTHAHGGDAQNLNKLYGQLGFAVQPTFADPFYMAYYQQPFVDAYGMSSQFEPSASRGVSIGHQVGALNSQKGSDTVSDDQKFQHHRGGFMSNLNQQRGVMPGPNYFGSMGVMQYTTQLHASPVMPGSPVSGANLNGERKEMRFSQAHSRSPGMYSGWQGQKGYRNYEDPKVQNFLEDLKSGKGRRFQLSDIAGHIVEFSADQHGSRFIQQKLENCSDEEKASVFKEVLPHAPKLMTDVFGNYVIQKFFEYGSPDQRMQIANQLAGHILPLSLQMYGCRVIQKALEVIELEQKAQLIHELDGHVIRCVRDQNGNHVIQKCIESVPTEKIGFIISAFRGQVATLSMHPYGCRVVQRVLEHCTDEVQCQFIVDEILDSVCDLAQDQYGNYVTQHVLERGKPDERGQIVNKFSGHIVQLSQHKFASNVVEKCLDYGDAAERELMIQEIVGHNQGVDNLLIMMKDQFANYVIQKVLEYCSDDQRAVLLGRIRVHVTALKKYTYGKHIAARFEQLYGENETSGSS